MRSLFLFATVSMCLVPTSLSAAEPSRGTVIMISSIGGWVLFSSGSVVLREMRRNRQKTDAENGENQQPKA